MLTAVVLINTAADLIPEAAAKIAEIPGVSEVYSVTGDTDLIAMVKVREHEELAGVIADSLAKVPGVMATRTYIAFKTYSSGELTQAYDLGLGD